MCIAILNTTGIIKKSVLKTCWTNNPDGAGLAYVEKGKIQIIKEMKDFNFFYKQYNAARQKNSKANFLIHFRIATHGKVNSTNCHPFLVNENLCFIHNGIISGTGLKDCPDFSDTYLFNQVILNKLPANFIENEAILNLLADYIGYSKLIFLDSADNWQIVNESLGHWKGENWFSNSSYLPYKAPEKKSNFSNFYDVDHFYSKKSLFDDELSNFKKYPETSLCECCDEVGKLKYVAEFNIDMCEKCISSYAKEYNGE